MIKLFNSVMGSIDSSSFAPRSKLNPLAAGLITAGGGLLSSLIGSSSNSKANATNLEIARMNNEHQYKMFKEQLAYNEDMWNKQNEYNDPSNQVQRLLAAGINPASVFGNGSVSEAGSLTAPQLPAMQQAHVNPYQPDLKVGDAVNAYFQSELANAQKKKMNAETAHTEALTLFENRSMDDRLRSLSAIAKGDDWRAEIARQEMNYLQNVAYWRVKQLRNDITLQDDQHKLTTEQIYNHRLMNGLAEVQLAYAPRLSEAQLKQYYATCNQIKAQIGLINANKLLTDEQRKHEIEKKTGQIIQNGLSGLSFELRKATQDYIEQQTIYETKQLINEVNDYEPNWWNRVIQGYIPFASGSATAATRRALYKW